MIQKTTKRILPLEVKGSEHRYSVYCDSLAYITDEMHYDAGRRNVILAVSFVGPSTSCRAILAALRSGKSSSATFNVIRYALFSNVILRQHLGGYDVRVSQVKCGNLKATHVVAVAKDDRIVLSDSDDSLWNSIRSDRFTTPVLRSWVPWIRETVKSSPAYGSCRILGKASGFQTDVCVFRCTTERLDDIVSTGIKDGHLVLE